MHHCGVSSKRVYFERASKLHRDIEEIGLNLVFCFFLNSVYRKLWEKKCYNGLGLVWSCDKSVSFRGRRVRQERAAVR